MLVSEETVLKWYHSDHFIYKNFAFLFSNGLYQNDVPKGFSVCPFFWMSMFSLFLYRPILYPILWTTTKLIQKFAIIGRADAYLRRIWNFQNGSVSPLLVILGVIFGCGLLLWGSIILFGAYVTSMYFSLPIYHVLIWNTLFGLCLTAGCAIWDDKHPYSKCQPKYYIWTWALLTVIGLASFMPNELLHVCIGTIKGILGFIGWGLSKIGYFISWCFSGAHNTVTSNGVLLSWMVPAMLVYGGVVYYIDSKIKKNPKFRKNYKDDYIYNIAKSIEDYHDMSYEFRHLIGIDWNNGDGNNFIGNYNFEIVSRFVELICKDELEENKYIKPQYKYNSNNSLRDNLSSILPNITNDKINSIYDIHNHGDVFKSEWEQIGKEYSYLKDVYEKYLERLEKKNEQKYARRNSMMKLCASITGFLAKMFSPIKSLFINIGVFFAFIWVLIVAKKKKACPYFQFIQVDEEETGE